MAKKMSVKIAIKYVLEIYKPLQGRPPSTWITAIKNGLKELVISCNETIEASTNLKTIGKI